MGLKGVTFSEYQETDKGHGQGNINGLTPPGKLLGDSIGNGGSVPDLGSLRGNYEGTSDSGGCACSTKKASKQCV